jgi:hypothetical protein
MFQDGFNNLLSNTIYAKIKLILFSLSKTHKLAGSASAPRLGMNMQNLASVQHLGASIPHLAVNRQNLQKHMIFYFQVNFSQFFTLTSNQWRYPFNHQPPTCSLYP